MAKRRPTQRQIAKEAQVSRTTVSLVLNNVPDVRISPETRQRILQVARRLNYYPDDAAQRLASGRTRTVALVWHRGPDATYRDAFLPGLLQGITRAARHYGYHVLFRPIEADEPQDRYVDLARSRHTDGLILSGPRFDDPCLRQLRQDRFPLVLHGHLPDSDIPSVDVDNVQGARAATEHLLAQGHSRVATITNAPLAYTASRQRLEGYRQSLIEAGLPYDERLIRHGNFDEESGQIAMESLLAQDDPPTAVFVASDMVAMGALRAIRVREMHVPRDIAVIGFDDIAAARFITPALTTVRVPTFELGANAATLLIQIIEGNPPDDQSIRLDTKLIVRESCGVNAS